jgi:hypothetical protein
VAAVLAACADAPTAPENPAATDPLVELDASADGRVAFGHDHGAWTWRATVRELAAARRATARYHRLERALADGFVDIDLFIPGMGYHYLNADRIDDTFDPARPEALVYSPDRQGRMRLVAVEYAVPLGLSPDAPPAGFTGSADAWDRNETFGLWTLHAWVWHNNPEGVFAPTNPRLR